MSDAPRKFCYLSGVDLMRLNDACFRITEAFGEPPYLVGSVNENPEFRDVDVRSILPDGDFDSYFPKGTEFFRSLFCMAVSEYLRAATGLPVDYQVQRMSAANEKFPSNKHKRNALGMKGRLYAGGGDAA